MHALSITRPMLKITRSAISRKPVNQKKVGQENMFLHLYTGFGVKIQNTHRYRNSATFLTSWQSALNSPANGPMVTYSKIQNRLSRATWDTPMDRFLRFSETTHFLKSTQTALESSKIDIFQK